MPLELTQSIVDIWREEKTGARTKDFPIKKSISLLAPFIIRNLIQIGKRRSFALNKIVSDCITGKFENQ